MYVSLKKVFSVDEGFSADNNLMIYDYFIRKHQKLKFIPMYFLNEQSMNVESMQD